MRANRSVSPQPAAERGAAQGVLDVIVNIRMTVVQLKSGGLFVYAPIAPTVECLRLLRELDAPVQYIVLPTSAVEHKVREIGAGIADARAGGCAHATTQLEAEHSRACTARRAAPRYFWGPSPAAFPTPRRVPQRLAAAPSRGASAAPAAKRRAPECAFS